MLLVLNCAGLGFRVLGSHKCDSSSNNGNNDPHQRKSTTIMINNVTEGEIRVAMMGCYRASPGLRSGELPGCLGTPL